jgi:hypothetical protein
MGKCAQETPNSLISPGSGGYYVAPSGGFTVTYCYVSDVDPEVYFEGCQDRGLSFLDAWRPRFSL